MECFRRQELLDWHTFQSTYGPALREGLPDCPATDVFPLGTEIGEKHWEDLRNRVVEHVREEFVRLSITVLCITLLYESFLCSS